MKKLISLIIIIILAVGVNATNTVIKNTDVQTSSGTLNVSIEQYSNGVYDLLIKEGSEQVYGKVSMIPRTALSAEMKQLVDSGEKGYFSNAYIKITKAEL